MKAIANDLRGTVFISCGQAKGEEESIAKAVADKLQGLGFDFYIAVQEQTLRGLKENIFRNLEKSEYFLFIDFKREPLQTRASPVCRGSLFSHQELAIASYLDINVLAFQESGVKQLDGILGFLQANAIPFSDRSQLPELIAEKVQEHVRSGVWDAHWKNVLTLEREATQFSDANRIEPQQPKPFLGRFFHIDVCNRHRKKIATNCYAYLEKAIDLETCKELPFKTVEYKWAGYILPNATILPRQARRLDAFWIDHRTPAKLWFNAFVDSNEYIPSIEEEGRYELTYVVVAENFPISRRSFTLDLNKSLDLTRFTALTSGDSSGGPTT
jgi:hypothetical protein